MVVVEAETAALVARALEAQRHAHRARARPGPRSPASRRRWRSASTEPTARTSRTGACCCRSSAPTPAARCCCSFAVRASARAARWAGLGVAFIDVPMVFLAQWASLPVSPSPGGVAGFSLGIFVLLVLLGGLSLDVRQMLLVALTAAVCEVLLPARGRDPRRRVGRVDRRDRLHRGRGRPPDRPGARAGGRRRHRAAQARAPRALLLARRRGAAADPVRPARRARRPGADRAVLRHPRLHHDVRRAAARRGRPPAQRILRTHGRARSSSTAARSTSSSATGSWRTSARRSPTPITRCTRSTARWRCSTSWPA